MTRPEISGATARDGRKIAKRMMSKLCPVVDVKVVATRTCLECGNVIVHDRGGHC